MRPVYRIIKASVGSSEFDELIKKLKGIVSYYVEAGYIIIARYNVNKTTLKKILKKHLDE